MLASNLDGAFRKIQLRSQFASPGPGNVVFLEEFSFQFCQLVPGECCPISSHLVVVVLVERLVLVAFVFVRV